jgi:hypothetical protein
LSLPCQLSAMRPWTCLCALASRVNARLLMGLAALITDPCDCATTNCTPTTFFHIFLSIGGLGKTTGSGRGRDEGQGEGWAYMRRDRPSQRSIRPFVPLGAPHLYRLPLCVCCQLSWTLYTIVFISGFICVFVCAPLPHYNKAQQDLVLLQTRARSEVVRDGVSERVRERALCS